tara:strand:+ start:54 stop:476 length:423 start_codon:yes stop_codon:yes gene_type:complete
MWDSLERKVMDFIENIDPEPIRPDYGFNYKGTMDLSFDRFPEVGNIYEEGKGSNILTKYDTDDLDNPTKWILYPTMVEGKALDSDGVDNLLHANEHFGIYDSKHEMEQADKNIHEYFENVRNDKNKDLNIDGRIRTIDNG